VRLAPLEVIQKTLVTPVVRTVLEGVIQHLLANLPPPAVKIVLQESTLLLLRQAYVPLAHRVLINLLQEQQVARAARLVSTQPLLEQQAA